MSAKEKQLKLKNPKFCNGRLCLKERYIKENLLVHIAECQKKYDIKLTETGHIIRPKQCIEENGK